MARLAFFSFFFLDFRTPFKFFSASSAAESAEPDPDPDPSFASASPSSAGVVVISAGVAAAPSSLLPLSAAAPHDLRVFNPKVHFLLKIRSQFYLHETQQLPFANL